jgi:cbb3-type cytochrome oxidase maturation protein
MNVLIYLVPMAIGLGLIALFAFLWALKSGQYEDIEGAALPMLADDDVDKGGPAPARAGESPGRLLP